ncbi:GntR family transcriptional regulator [bacterium]|nr:MAG: GntR family transcriptional regulator [bacterium]
MQTPPIDILDRTLILHHKHELPLHSQVRQALRGIIDAHFDDGQQFWTEGALIEKLGVSRITVRRALEDLQREGVLNRQRAKGSFVCKSDSDVTVQFAPYIGILVPNCNSPFLTALLEQLGLASTKQKQRVTIHLYERGQNIGEMLHRLEHGAEEEALILLGSPYDMSQDMYDALRASNYRVVCVDSPARNAPFVGVDNEAGIRMGLEHLRDQGHRRIAYIANESSQHPNVAERIQVFTQLGQEWGMETQVFNPGTRVWESSYDAALQVLEDVVEWGATAIFTASDEGAWATMKWLREHGIEVPNQISVLGFDDAKPSAHTFPALSSVATPPELIAQYTLELLNSPDLHTAFWPKRALVTPRLVVRESTTATIETTVPQSTAC